MKRTPLLLLTVIGSGVFLAACAQPVHPAQGEATRAAQNGRDIHHPSNDAFRVLLLQEAVQDAIERSAGISISVTTVLDVQERRGTETTFFVEILRANTVQRIGIRWRRESAYRFARHPSLRHAWTCSVTGTVQELPMTSEPAVDAAAISAEKGIILSRRLGDVQLRPPAGEVYAPGDRLVVQGGPASASVLVTHVQDGLVTGRIIRGRSSVRMGQRIDRGEFPLLRGGIKLRMSGAMGSERTTSNDPASDHVLSVLSVEVFEYSLVEQWGVLFGLDIAMGTWNGQRSTLDLLPHAGAYRPFALLPEVLYLGPYMNAGIGFIDADHPDFGHQATLYVEPGIEAELRLGAIELCAGARYRAVGGLPALSGGELFIGAQLDLYRLAGRTEARTRPSLLPGLQAMRNGIRTLSGRK